MIAIEIREFNALFYAIVDFFFYDMATDMQIWALLTESWCIVSDTQVTVKSLTLRLPLRPVGLFFVYFSIQSNTSNYHAYSLSFKENPAKQYGVYWMVCPHGTSCEKEQKSKYWSTKSRALMIDWLLLFENISFI